MRETKPGAVPSLSDVPVRADAGPSRRSQAEEADRLARPRAPSRSAWPRSMFVAALVLASALSVGLVILRWQLSPPPAFALDLGEPSTNASHFFGIESSEDRRFRWSRTLSAVSLPALASSQVVTVTADPARPDVTFRLLVVEKVIGEYEAVPGWASYTATVGARAAPDIRLLIESDTFYPSAGDRRRLGIAVATIESAPVPGKFGLLPPLLWLAVAALLPLVAFAAALRKAPRLAWLVPFAGALVPVSASVILPSESALPLVAWATGIAGLVLFVVYARSWLADGGWIGRALNKVGNSRGELPAVALLISALSALFTWPVVSRLDSAMPGWPADNFAFLYKFWWFRTALLERGVSPFFDPNSFAPFGFNLGQGEPTLANTVPGVLIGAATNDVIAYNIVALSSFVVSGLGAYLLVRELTGHRGAALLAAIGFAFCPYRMSQYGGHIQLLGTGWIALAFYFVERTFRGRKWTDGAWAGTFLALAALSAWYYAYMVGLMLTLYVLVRVWLGRKEMRVSKLLAPAVAFLVALGVLVVPVALPSASIWGAGELRHSAKAADEHSAAPSDYAVPNPLHPVWGEPGMRAHSEQNVIESSLYVGLPLLVITIAGLLLAIRTRIVTYNRSMLAWAAVLFVSTILSLGLTLHDTGGQVQMQSAEGGTPLALPGQLLYDWLPLYSSMRAYARFGLLTILALAVLMGASWTVIAARWRRYATWLTLVASILLLADFWTGPYSWGTSRVQPTEASRFLAAAPAGTIMQMPLNSAVTGPALYRATDYGKPISYGYDTFEPTEWREARDELATFPEAPALNTLRSWGVRYIVVSANAHGADWPGTSDFLLSLPDLRHLGDFPEARVWEVDPAVVDARPDMEEYLVPDTHAVFELLPGQP